MTARAAAAINAGVAAQSRVCDDPTPALDAAVIGDMTGEFLRAFRRGGDAGDTDLAALGFTPAQIDRYGARALVQARCAFAGRAGREGRPAPRGADVKSATPLPAPSRRAASSG